MTLSYLNQEGVLSVPLAGSETDRCNLRSLAGSGGGMATARQTWVFWGKWLEASGCNPGYECLRAEGLSQEASSATDTQYTSSQVTQSRLFRHDPRPSCTKI